MLRRNTLLTLPNRPAWFPDVYNCRCYSQAQNLAAIQPLCSAGGGGDMTVYPPGNYVWVSTYLLAYGL
jgi:hypothetical protein